MVMNRSLMPGFRSLVNGDVGARRRDVAEHMQGCWRSCYKAGNGMSVEFAEDAVPVSDHRLGSSRTRFVAACIIANRPSFAQLHCAEKSGILLHIMVTPYTPVHDALRYL